MLLRVWIAVYSISPSLIDSKDLIQLPASEVVSDLRCTSPWLSWARWLPRACRAVQKTWMALAMLFAVTKKNEKTPKERSKEFKENAEAELNKK